MWYRINCNGISQTYKQDNLLILDLFDFELIGRYDLRLTGNMLTCYTSVSHANYSTNYIVYQ